MPHPRSSSARDKQATTPEKGFGLPEAKRRAAPDGPLTSTKVLVAHAVDLEGGALSPVRSSATFFRPRSPDQTNLVLPEFDGTPLP